MSDERPSQSGIRPGTLMDALYRDNGKWAFVYVAIASGAATFVLAGRLGWEIGAAVIVVLVITALSLTTLREMQARKVAEAKAQLHSNGAPLQVPENSTQSLAPTGSQQTVTAAPESTGERGPAH